MTLLGGFLSLRLSRHLQWLTSFSSGVLIGVAVLRLLPEAFDLRVQEGLLSLNDSRQLLQAAGIGFVVFYLLDLIVPEHHAKGHEDHAHAPAIPRVIGVLAALVICMHEILDGLMVGAAKHAHDSLAHAVGFALLFHNFSDGISIVGAMLRNGQTMRRTHLMMIVMSLCPLLGFIISSYFHHVSVGILSMILALCAGIFLYVGGSHLSIKEHGVSKHLRPFLTALGFVSVLIF